MSNWVRGGRDAGPAAGPGTSSHGGSRRRPFAAAGLLASLRRDGSGNNERQQRPFSNSSAASARARVSSHRIHDDDKQRSPQHGQGEQSYSYADSRSASDMLTSSQRAYSDASPPYPDRRSSPGGGKMATGVHRDPRLGPATQPNMGGYVPTPSQASSQCAPLSLRKWDSTQPLHTMYDCKCASAHGLCGCHEVAVHAVSRSLSLLGKGTASYPFKFFQPIHLHETHLSSCQMASVTLLQAKWLPALLQRHVPAASDRRRGFVRRARRL